MPPKPPTARMGELHEEYLAEVNDGRKSKSSGNQWSDPADGRNHHDDPFAFAWDGKSTLGQSISVTLAMIAKIRDQANPERPEIGLRWYANEMLTGVLEDWIAVPSSDFQEMKIAATAYELARPQVEGALADLAELGTQNENLTAGLAAALEQVARLKETVTEAAAAQERPIPGFVPRLPWVTVHHAVDADFNPVKVRTSGVRYEEDGRQIPFEVTSIRVERHMNNRPRLFVNDSWVRDGDLYREGILVVRACLADRSVAETG